MPTPNEVFTEALIAQNLAFQTLVATLEYQGAIPTGVVRDAIERLIENLGAGSEYKLAHLNEILRGLPQKPPA
ncbi:hypothetical protein [Hyphomicrobium sp. MC8b]|uniref:hypothetical protein n=1 Tax=Hyphomicrobium sp. MC8b TaxID=300273 RepID=UPI00391B48FD